MYRTGAVKVSREGLRQRSVPDLCIGLGQCGNAKGQKKENAYRALRVKFPSHGGTSTLAGVLKYLNEALSGGMAVRCSYRSRSLKSKSDQGFLGK